MELDELPFWDDMRTFANNQTLGDAEMIYLISNTKNLLTVTGRNVTEYFHLLTNEMHEMNGSITAVIDHVQAYVSTSVYIINSLNQSTLHAIQVQDDLGLMLERGLALNLTIDHIKETTAYLKSASDELGIHVSELLPVLLNHNMTLAMYSELLLHAIHDIRTNNSCDAMVPIVTSTDSTIVTFKTMLFQYFWISGVIGISIIAGIVSLGILSLLNSNWLNRARLKGE
jgi:hypothetical protein